MEAEEAESSTPQSLLISSVVVWTTRRWREQHRRTRRDIKRVGSGGFGVQTGVSGGLGTQGCVTRGLESTPLCNLTNFPQL